MDLPHVLSTLLSRAENHQIINQSQCSTNNPGACNSFLPRSRTNTLAEARQESRTRHPDKTMNMLFCLFVLCSFVSSCHAGKIRRCLPIKPGAARVPGPPRTPHRCVAGLGRIPRAILFYACLCVFIVISPFVIPLYRSPEKRPEFPLRCRKVELVMRLLMIGITSATSCVT